MSEHFTESIVEEAALWLEGLGYGILSGPCIAPGEVLASGAGARWCFLKRLRHALQRLDRSIA